MSVIAYFVHVDEAQLKAVRARPEVIWEIPQDRRFAGAALFDIDKDYDILSWLVSENKRREQAIQIATYKAIEREAEAKAGEKLAAKVDQQPDAQAGPSAFQRLRAEELRKLGVDEDLKPGWPDVLQQAIEGRCAPAARDPKIDLGMGGACVYSIEDVKRLSAALTAVADADLRTHFNRETMTRFDVGGMDWTSESDEVLDKFLLPALHRLQAFYAEAAKRRHRVFVIYQ